MSIAQDLFLAVLSTMMFAAILSVATGVGGCWCLTFAKAVLMEVDFWKISNKRPNSSSVAGAITFLTMTHYT